MRTFSGATGVKDVLLEVLPLRQAKDEMAYSTIVPIDAFITAPNSTISKEVSCNSRYADFSTGGCTDINFLQYHSFLVG